MQPPPTFLVLMTREKLLVKCMPYYRVKILGGLRLFPSFPDCLALQLPLMFPLLHHQYLVTNYAWLYSQLSGNSIGAAWAVLLSPTVLLGEKHPSARKSRRLFCLGKRKNKATPTNEHFWRFASQVPLRELSCIWQVVLSMTHKEILPHKLKTHEFAVMKHYCVTLLSPWQNT